MKIDKFLEKVMRRQSAFPRSEADLALLRSITEGRLDRTKPGDWSFHGYAAALNVASEFASQALDILELIPFNNKLADVQEEYMPSYPPMSPVTSAFFAAWMVLDAQDPLTGKTLGELFAHYLEARSGPDLLQRALSALNDSHCAFYEVRGVDSGEVRLWDIAGRREFQCWNSSGYAGRKGEVWFVRVLPPLLETGERSVTMNTPYVFVEGGRRPWEDFFERCPRSRTGSNAGLRDYLKFGQFLGYWLEFVVQAYVNHTGNAIFVMGFPDRPDSMPHSEHCRKL